MFGKPVPRIPGGNIKPPSKPITGPKCPCCGRPKVSAILKYDTKLKKTVLKCPCGHSFG